MLVLLDECCTSAVFLVPLKALVKFDPFEITKQKAKQSDKAMKKK